MTTSMLVDARAGGSNAPSSAGLPGARSNLPAPTVQNLSLPTSIPAGELYYWTAAWQVGEAESAIDRQRGDVVRFTDAHSTIRWLLSAEE